MRNGKDGSYGFSINEEEKAAAFNVKVEDTVGAGDVYNAGFISARLNGQSLKESLILGKCRFWIYGKQKRGTKQP